MTKTNTNSRVAFLQSLREKMTDKKFKGGSGGSNDDRYWKPELDKVGNGSAVIRFLPAPKNEAFPYVEIFNHSFKGPEGKWFWQNCPHYSSNYQKPCPACADIKPLWDGSEADKSLARVRKAKQNYVSNIFVISDPKHPENEGKVFLFKYGKKIFGKIKDMVNPPEEFDDMEPMNPFCHMEGANFKLRITKQDGFPNYDKSVFASPSALLDGDEDEIAKLLEKCYSLEEIKSDDKFKSYEELDSLYRKAVYGDEAPAERKSSVKSAAIEADDEEDVPFVPTSKPAAKKAAAAASSTTKKAAPKPVVQEEDEDEDDDFFANLAKQTDED